MRNELGIVWLGMCERSKGWWSCLITGSVVWGLDLIKFWQDIGPVAYVSWSNNLWFDILQPNYKVYHLKGYYRKVLKVSKISCCMEQVDLFVTLPFRWTGHHTHNLHVVKTSENQSSCMIFIVQNVLEKTSEVNKHWSNYFSFCHSCIVFFSCFSRVELSSPFAYQV